jgi:hypothetical protein
MNNCISKFSLRRKHCGLARFAGAVMGGRKTRPYSGIGFENMAQFGECYPETLGVGGIPQATGP